jgi:hypothetical protein
MRSASPGSFAIMVVYFSMMLPEQVFVNRDVLRYFG